MPIVGYGSELGLLRSNAIEDVRTFQRYGGRRYQRLPGKSPN